MADWLQRSRALIGDMGIEILKNSRVAVVGLGGVGSAAAEALVRAGVGNLYIVDFDRVAETDCNRQLIALRSEVGRLKAEVAAERYLNINARLNLVVKAEWLNEDTVAGLVDFKPDFVVDAIDKVTYKLLLIEAARASGADIISSMGTGKRIDAGRFKIGPVTDTAGSKDGLARVMRRELRRRGLSDTTVLYSTEDPCTDRADIIASISFVPPVAGYLIAGQAVRTLLNKKRIFSVETERLLLLPKSVDRLKDDLSRESDPEMIKAYGDMLREVAENPGDFEWGTEWDIIEKGGGSVGGICFKGAPSGGMVEVGYGINESARRRGYATEAVAGITAWALSRPGVTRVTGMTEPGNEISKRILLKNGFTPCGMGSEGPLFEKLK